MMKASLMIWMAAAAMAMAGPYAPRAGVSGSTAIHKDDARFVAWANGNLTPEYGTDVDAEWKTPAKAWGKATTDIYDIVCLGNGGRITMFFPHAIKDGAGADFAVFENAFGDNFLELAFVEVSSDGANFFRFPAHSLTASLVGGFGNVDPTNIDGFAGKYRSGYGTPFDLADLPDSPLLDKQRVRFVRIVDIVGDRWSHLILGVAIMGVTRFDDFQTCLEIAPNILSDRLRLLVDGAEVFGVDVPPVIEAASRDRIEAALRGASEAGAKVVRGAGGPDGSGFYVTPSIVVGAPVTNEPPREHLDRRQIVVAAGDALACAA